MKNNRTIAISVAFGAALFVGACAADNAATETVEVVAQETEYVETTDESDSDETATMPETGVGTDSAGDISALRAGDTLTPDQFEAAEEAGLKVFWVGARFDYTDSVWTELTTPEDYEKGIVVVDGEPLPDELIDYLRANYIINGTKDGSLILSANYQLRGFEDINFLIFDHPEANGWYYVPLTGMTDQTGENNERFFEWFEPVDTEIAILSMQADGPSAEDLTMAFQSHEDTAPAAVRVYRIDD